MVKVIVGMTDDYTKKLTMECVSKALPKAQLIDGSSDMEIFYHLQKSEDETIVIFDRFFLSYILKFKLIYLKAMNNRMKIVFCERGSCIREFGLRLYELGVDGFICDIEHEDLFVAKLKKVKTGGKCFPDEMKDSEGYLDINTDRKACVEITCAEFTVGVYLGKGFTNKEISRITGLSINAVRNHAHWLKKKIGYKSMNDLTVLNQRYDLLDIRSWNIGCKN